MKRKLLILSLMIGIAIVIYPYVGQYIGNQIQKKRSEQFQQYVQQLSDEEKKRTQENIEQCVEKVTESDFDFYDPWSEETNEDIFAECVDDETFGNQGENPESTTSGISDLDSISTLEIPKLNLSIPIYLGSSEASLSRGLGQVEGSSLPFGGIDQRTVLAGHRGMGTREMFRNLDKLQPGDIFYIHTFKEKLTYKVYEQQVIYPDETDALQIEPGRDLATLLTCHPYRHNYQRLLIHGERVDGS